MKKAHLHTALSFLAASFALSACGSSGEVYMTRACYKASSNLCIEVKGYEEFRESDDMGLNLAESCVNFGGTSSNSDTSIDTNCNDTIGALGQSVVGYCDFNAGTHGFASFPETVFYSGAGYNAASAQNDCNLASGSWHSP